jgi:hypothetical protein
MTWATVLLVVLQYLGPVLAEWFIRMLNDAAREATHAPSSDAITFRDDLHELFAAVRAKTWWWQFRRRAAIELASRMVMRRWSVIQLAAKDESRPRPVLGQAQREELAAAFS